MTETYVDELVVAALVEYGDTDLVVRFVSRGGGRGSAFARAARRSKKRFAGSLQVLARGRATLRPRRGGALPSLETFEATPDLFGFAVDPKRYGRGCYVVEVTERLLPEAESTPDIYDTLTSALALISDGRADARLLRAYELKLLSLTGYLPDLSEEGDWLDGATGALSETQGPGTVPFEREARLAARALVGAPLGAAPEIADQTLRVVGRLFASHLRRMEVRDLKSVAFLKSIA